MVDIPLIERIEIVIKKIKGEPDPLKRAMHHREAADLLPEILAALIRHEFESSLYTNFGLPDDYCDSPAYIGDDLDE